MKSLQFTVYSLQKRLATVLKRWTFGKTSNGTRSLSDGFTLLLKNCLADTHASFDYFRKHGSSTAGFTLVETLVSLIILSVTIVPIISLSSNIARINTSLQDNLIASGLAQEGVEVIRAIRDTNWFNNQAFDYGLGNGVVGGVTTYQVEWDSTLPLSPVGSSPLNLNNGRYTYLGGTPSKFSRTVTVTKINTGELKIISTVTWLGRGETNKSINTELHLFNWK